MRSTHERTIGKLAIAAAVTLAPASAMAASYGLVAPGKPVAVASSSLWVTPAKAWNRLRGADGATAESWTLDGLILNNVTFYGGLAGNTPLLASPYEKGGTLPRFASTMAPADVAQLFAASYRTGLGSSDMSVSGVEETVFAGRPGFRFGYSFVLPDDPARRIGEANGAILGGRLFLITYEAPATLYYQRSLADYHALTASARFAAPKRRR